MTLNVASKFVFLGLIGVAVVLEVVGDFFFKKFSLENKTPILVFGLFIYFIGTIFWAFSLKYEYLSKAISIFTILNLVIVALIGILYFKEQLSIVNKVGIVLGVLSIILVEL